MNPTLMRSQLEIEIQKYLRKNVCVTSMLSTLLETRTLSINKLKTYSIYNINREIQ